MAVRINYADNDAPHEGQPGQIDVPVGARIDIGAVAITISAPIGAPVGFHAGLERDESGEDWPAGSGYLYPITVLASGVTYQPLNTGDASDAPSDAAEA